MRRLARSPATWADPYSWGLEYINFPQLVAARARCRRSRATACSSKAARSAAASNAWVGKTQAVGHRVIPLVRMNSATASPSSSFIVYSPSTTSRLARCLQANRPLRERQNGYRPIAIMPEPAFRHRCRPHTVRKSSWFLANYRQNKCVQLRALSAYDITPMF
jgi:hypothetical protein